MEKVVQNKMELAFRIRILQILGKTRRMTTAYRAG
jgi:hypothetical protein